MASPLAAAASSQTRPPSTSAHVGLGFGVSVTYDYVDRTYLINGEVSATVPAGADFGPFTITTAGGTSNAFRSTVSTITSAAYRYACRSDTPSANPGQAITLSGTDSRLPPPSFFRRSTLTAICTSTSSSPSLSQATARSHCGGSRRRHDRDDRHCGRCDGLQAAAASRTDRHVRRFHVGQRRWHERSGPIRGRGFIEGAGYLLVWNHDGRRYVRELRPGRLLRHECELPSQRRSEPHRPAYRQPIRCGDRDDCGWDKRAVHSWPLGIQSMAAWERLPTRPRHQPTPGR